MCRGVRPEPLGLVSEAVADVRRRERILPGNFALPPVFSGESLLGPPSSQQMTMASILVLGSTGYIGGRLVPRLLERGHSVRCLVRNPQKLPGHVRNRIQIAVGDILEEESLGDAFRGVDILFYLVHSMSSGEEEFERRDRKAAENVAAAAQAAGVRRIIYLGGLGRRGEGQSPHLRSRHEVGDILRSSGVPVTEFRAAVIIGSGSASFEMMHHLVNRLPVMIAPRWVSVRTQPIAVDDVLRYLLAAVEEPATAGKTLDIGGPDIITYGDMMLTVARVLGLRRLIVKVPVLTPRLSSYWVNLVTPIPTSLARALIESLRSETVVENNVALELLDLRPVGFEEAVRLALQDVRTRSVETLWTSATSVVDSQRVDASHLRTDEQVVEADVPAPVLFAVVSSIGGENGWHFANWLWKLRGFIDKQFGGVGLLRGRRHPTELRVG